MVTHARIGGSEGMRLSRAAFAVIIKFSEYWNDISIIIDEINLFNTGPSIGDKELIERLKNLKNFDHISKRWEIASKMRIWIN